MSNQNPVKADLVNIPIDGSASNPSISIGGNLPANNSGTGIYGTVSEFNISIEGTRRAYVDASGIHGQIANILALESDASAGGAAEEVLVIDGLLATDTILSVTQMTPGANDLPLLGYSDQDDDELNVIYSADPGAGAVIVVQVKR
jgi:hypothetical protein